jgi:hypothetical protein
MEIILLSPTPSILHDDDPYVPEKISTMVYLPTQFCWAGKCGPLTTTFTPPSTCLGATSLVLYGLDIPRPSQDTIYYVGVKPGGGGVSDSCMPPAATPVNLGQGFYYLPGICPDAYSPAAQLLTLPNICNSAAALPETVTAWVCCPMLASA